MDIRMVAAAHGAWVIMAIHREGMEVTGVEIMGAVEEAAGVEMEDMVEEGGITKLKMHD